MTKRMVIAIDGPAASGKSSTAQWVARRLGYFHVDSGSLYRAATAARLARGGEPEVLAESGRVAFVPAEGAFVPTIDGSSADDLLRGGDVTRNVSRVARMG